MNPEEITKRSARMALQSLTDDELAALNSVVQIGGDPRATKGYTKVNHLFTEANGTGVHPLIRDAFAAEVNSRPAFSTKLHRIEAEVMYLHQPHTTPPALASLSAEELRAKVAQINQHLVPENLQAVMQHLYEVGVSQQSTIDVSYQLAAQQSTEEGQAEADQQILDAQQEPLQQRDNKIWRNFSTSTPFPLGWPRSNPLLDTLPPFSPEQAENVDQPSTHESLWAEKRTDLPFMLPQRDDPKVPLPAPSFIQRAAQKFEDDLAQSGLGPIIAVHPGAHPHEQPAPNEDQAHEGDTKD